MQKLYTPISLVIAVLAFSLHNHQGGGDSNFYDLRCRQYSSLYMRYVISIGQASFSTVYSMVCQPDARWKFLLAGMATDPAFAFAADVEAILSPITSPSIKTEESIYSISQDATDILNDDALRDFLPASDFDLRQIAKKLTAIFLCIKHDELRYMAACIRMFTDFLLNTLTTHYNPARKVLVCRMILPNLGT